MISLPEKKNFCFHFCQNVNVDVIGGEKCHYENDEMSFLGQRKNGVKNELLS